MFLSRMEFNPQRRGAHKLLGSPQAMHAAVMSSFAHEAEHGSDSRVLWRVDAEGARTLLYVVSQVQPCFRHLQEQAGWTTTVTWASRPYGRLLDRLAQGQIYAFRLTANPGRVVTASNGRKRRVGFFRESDQVAWLMGKARVMGVDFGAVDAPGFAVKQARRRDFNRQGQTVTIMQVTFEGSLTVLDPECLRRILINGVGPAKAYGCGLLTVAGTRGH